MSYDVLGANAIITVVLMDFTDRARHLKPVRHVILNSLPALSSKNERITYPFGKQSLSKKMYPHSFSVTTSFKSFIEQYQHLKNEETVNDKVSLAGRIMEKRSFGKHLVFLTVKSNGHNLQFMLRDQEGDYHRGDIVGATGSPIRTKAGELSLLVSTITMIAPCTKPLPRSEGLTDLDSRVKQRHLDLILHDKVRQNLQKRNKVFRLTREFLDSRDFVEIQTPVLSLQASGANAKPFVTYHNDLKQQMYLRIAPELYLKKMVVGGFDRVYEIGPQFRNEDIDHNHVPEFYSLEFYMAYADYSDMISLCETLISHIVSQVCGLTQIDYLGNMIDFTPPYLKIDIIPYLEEKLNIVFPSDLLSQEGFNFLNDISLKYKIDCSYPKTALRLMDKIIGHFIEPECRQPTFLLNHPLLMSPLAKEHRSRPGVSERFELFVCGMELCNAYTELNDPHEQKKRFLAQMEDKKNGDDEAQSIDHSFIDALELGMPCCGGFGLGLERLVMLLCNEKNIRETLAFPPCRDV